MRDHNPEAEGQWWQDFLIPADEKIAHHSYICARNVLNGAEYAYPRERAEDVKTLVDVGTNLGQFICWAKRHWPGLVMAWGYEPNDAAQLVACWQVAALGMSALVTCAAVTTNLAPRLMPEPGLAENWGGWRTHNATEGEPVNAVHPRDLPAADLLKIDCEGSEAEIVDHYQHWAGVKVLCLEIHGIPDEDRHRMHAIIRNAGLVMRRGNLSDPSWDTQVWVRP
jgi:FkbM family methyltransferase